MRVFKLALTVIGGLAAVGIVLTVAGVVLIAIDPSAEGIQAALVPVGVILAALAALMGLVVLHGMVLMRRRLLLVARPVEGAYAALFAGRRLGLYRRVELLYGSVAIQTVALEVRHEGAADRHIAWADIAELRAVPLPTPVRPYLPGILITANGETLVFAPFDEKDRPSRRLRDEMLSTIRGHMEEVRPNG